MSDLNFSEYWSGNKNHVEAASSGNIFNLWRIVNSEKEFYASNIAEYLQRNYFNKKDLSALSVGLVEAFYNVFDHAKAGENAFLLLKYDSVKQKLKVAISDFGIGISESVRTYNPEVAATDIDAIQWAILDHSTVKSTSHNMGLGMGNILSMASEARIFSGNGLLILKGNLFKPFTINFSFPGTLIYLDVDLLSFDDVEVFDSFNW